MVRTEHDIVSQVQSAKTDSEAADALIRQYMGFIRSETVKFLHTAPENGHEDELSIAMLAFYEAVLAYEDRDDDRDTDDDRWEDDGDDRWEDDEDDWDGDDDDDGDDDGERDDDD